MDVSEIATMNDSLNSSWQKIARFRFLPYAGAAVGRMQNYVVLESPNHVQAWHGAGRGDGLRLRGGGGDFVFDETPRASALRTQRRPRRLMRRRHRLRL
eukprot:scaffold6008_cov118-Isochrysis_galbana.AAC.1